MFSESFGFGLLLSLFSSFVVYRVIPLLLSHYEILSPLSARVQCRDSKNVTQKRPPDPVIARTRPA
jgi:hypothetical protein